MVGISPWEKLLTSSAFSSFHKAVTMFTVSLLVFRVKLLEFSQNSHLLYEQSDGKSLKPRVKSLRGWQHHCKFSSVPFSKTSLTHLTFFLLSVHPWRRRCPRRGKICSFVSLDRLDRPTNLMKSFNFPTMKVRNFGFGNRTCLDAQGGKKGLRKPVSLYPCHRQGGNQVNRKTSSHDKEFVCRLVAKTELQAETFFFSFRP